MFVVTSSRLVCSALRLLSTLAESPVMFRAFPLLSATARAIIPRAVLPDMRVAKGNYIEISLNSVRGGNHPCLLRVR